MKFRIETEPDSNYENGIQFFSQKSPERAVSAEAHIHGAIEIIFVTEGSFTVFSDSNEYDIFAGDMILFRSNMMHNIFSKEQKSNEYYVLKLKPEIIRDIIGGMNLLNFVFNRNDFKCVWTKNELKSDNDISDGFKRLLREFAQKSRYSDISVKLAVGQILLGILRSHPIGEYEIADGATAKTADCIYKAMAYINSNYQEDITETQISAFAGLSYHYFSRSFKQITGKSFKEYLNITRINHAERLLVTTDKSVSEIASECGYNDTSYFIKLYKKHKNTSPGMTRNQKQGI